MRRLAFLLPALLASRQAEAHIVASRLGDFYAGAIHPMTDPRDVVIWGGIGVLAGSMGAQRGRWLVLLFPIGLLAGLAVGQGLGLASPGLLTDAAIMAALGLLLAGAVRLPATVLWALAMILAASRGMANAGGMGTETNQTLFAAGLAMSGYAAITLTMALTLAFVRSGGGAPRGWRGIALRACGSWIAAAGVMLGGFALARG